MAANKKKATARHTEDTPVKSFLDMIAPSVVQFNPDHFICGNTFRCVWALREYPTQTDEQALLRHLGEKDGITLRIYTRQLTPAEEKRIIQNAANKNRMGSSNTNDLQQTITAESNLQDMISMEGSRHRNKEPLFHCAVYIELTASDHNTLKLLQTDVLTELVRSKLNVDRLLLRQQQGFCCASPVGYNAFGAQFERVLPASSVANLYPFNYSGKTDAKGFYVGRDKYGSNILVDFDQRDEDKTSANILSELEQILCFDSAIDAEIFAAEKSAIFLILPEEDQTKNFMAGLMIQNLSRELFAVADENGGKLKNRVILFCDELGTMPPFDILPLFSAGRSRRLTLVPIIQSLAQLEKNYGKEGASILMDNCQDVICGGFAPNSEAADTFSKALGSRTVLSGSVSRGKNDPSQSLQMMERPLLTADELKSIPKGSFIVQKTGCHPMRTRLRLFLEWGITFEEEYRVEEQAARKVYYADQNALTRAIVRKYPPKLTEQKTTRSIKGEGQLHDAPAQEMVVAEDIDYDRMPHKRAPYNLPRQEVDR